MRVLVVDDDDALRAAVDETSTETNEQSGKPGETKPSGRGWAGKTSGRRATVSGRGV
jgi:hypothetical protein